jgi:methyl-accepting chemotaxis protein
MSEDKKRINVYISNDLYVRVAHSDYTLTDAVIKGIEKLLEPPSEEIRIETIETIEPKLLEEKERIIKGLEARINDKDSNYQERITDLKDEISLLRDQLKEKDSQIKNLATITESQARSVKMIEAPGNKKSWWKFWERI